MSKPDWSFYGKRRRALLKKRAQATLGYRALLAEMGKPLYRIIREGRALGRTLIQRRLRS